MEKVYVLTYNTMDKPERRMIWGVYHDKAKAEENRQVIIRQFGSYLADTEIDGREVEYCITNGMLK